MRRRWQILLRCTRPVLLCRRCKIGGVTLAWLIRTPCNRPSPNLRRFVGEVDRATALRALACGSKLRLKLWPPRRRAILEGIKQDSAATHGGAIKDLRPPRNIAGARQLWPRIADRGRNSQHSTVAARGAPRNLTRVMHKQSCIEERSKLASPPLSSCAAPPAQRQCWAASSGGLGGGRVCGGDGGIAATTPDVNAPATTILQ